MGIRIQWKSSRSGYGALAGKRKDLSLIFPVKVATNHQFKWGTETSPQPVQVLVFILHFWRAVVVHFKNCSSYTIPLWAHNHSLVHVFLEFSPTGNWEPTLGHLQIKTSPNSSPLRLRYSAKSHFTPSEGVLWDLDIVFHLVFWHSFSCLRRHWRESPSAVFALNRLSSLLLLCYHLVLSCSIFFFIKLESRDLSVFLGKWSVKALVIHK